MINFIKNFRTDEDGAVTVDWVVLTAAVVALGIGALSVIGGKVTTLTGKIGDGVAGAEANLDTAIAAQPTP